MEDEGGEGEQECWFGEKGCNELSEMESKQINDSQQLCSQAELAHSISCNTRL